MSLFQIVWILSAILLALIVVFFGATRRHGFRWLFSRPALRLHTWVLVSLVTIVTLYYVGESWRGKRAWAAVQSDTAARGESLQFGSLATPPVPEDQDFAKAPGIAELLISPDTPREEWPFYHGKEDQWPSASWVSQQSTDLAAWQKFLHKQAVRQEFFRKPGARPAAPPRATEQRATPARPEPQAPAAGMLLALEPFRTNLATLAAASHRTVMRVPLDFGKSYYAIEDLIRPSASLRDAGHLLSLRASAELAQGQAGLALQDVLLSLRLAELLREAPFDLVHRHRQGMLMDCLQPVWEGLARHQWDDRQLAALEERLGKLSPLGDFNHVVRGETLQLINLVDEGLAFVTGQPTEFVRRHPPDEAGERLLHAAVRILYPVGWLYQDKTWIYRFYERHADPFQALSLRRQSREQFRAELRAIADPMLVNFVLPKVRHLFEQGAAASLAIQTFLEEAQTACALERFRLAQGQYPANLAALAPDYLRPVPVDLLAPTRANLNYRRTPHGGFLLHSVGFNAVDDGGMTPPPTGSCDDLLGHLARGDSDLVWAQPDPP